MPAPVNTTPPAIVGDDSDQGVLSVTPGVWTGDRDYQWLADGVAISGETGSSFTKSEAVVGKTITVRETATNGAGAANATSAGLGPLEYTLPVNSAPPAISGAALEGETLSATTGTWSEAPTSYAFQWKRGGVAISGATASSYVLVFADAGAVITVEVAATNSAGSASATSDPTAVVLPLAPTSTAAPVVSGTATQGETLTVTPGSYTGSPVVTRQWRRNGSAIAGASGLTYQLASADVGQTVDCLETAANTGGSIAVDSNDKGPVAALVWSPPTYTFTGTAGTKLSAIPNWELASPSGNGDSIEINASNQLRKLSSAEPALYLEGGGGARTQRIAANILANFNYWIGCMCTWASGIDGYFLRRSGATSARLLRVTAGGQTNLIGTISCGSGVLGLEAIVAADDTSVQLNVYEDGVLIDAQLDSSSSRKTRGRIGIAGNETPGGANPCFDNVTTYATGFFGGTGQLQSVDAGLIGRATPASNLAMNPALPSLGLLASGEVGLWQFTKVSGNAKWPDSVANGLTPAPTSALDSTDAGDVVVYSVVIDGVASGETLTMTVQSTTGAAAQSIASEADIGRLALGGSDPLVWFVDGCRDSWSSASAFSNGSPATFGGKTAHTGTLTITAPAPTVRIPAINIVDCVRVDLTGLTIDGHIPEPYDVVGDPYADENEVYGPGHNNAWPERQNKELVRVHGEGSQTVRVFGNVIGAPASLADSPMQWLTGVRVEGGADAAQIEGVIVGLAADAAQSWVVDYDDLEDDIPPLTGGNVIRRVNQGITGTNLKNVTFRGNIVRDFASNAHFLGGESCVDVAIMDALVMDRVVNPADPGTHGDGAQFGANVEGDYVRCGQERMIFISRYGNGVFQGPFFADIATYDASYTGFECVDCYVRNVAYAAGSNNGIVMDVGEGWEVANVSLLPAYSGTPYSGPPRVRGIDANYGGVPKSAVGTAARVGGYALQGSGIAYDSACFNIATLGEAAHYDNPSHADPILRFKPKAGGGFDLGGGTWGGCFNDDMTWAS